VSVGKYDRIQSSAAKLVKTINKVAALHVMELAASLPVKQDMPISI